MNLTELHLTHFRNYEKCSISDLSKVNLFLGRNGSGKTNLIDAVHYACFGRSYFSSTDKKVKQWDADFFRIESKIERENASYQVVAKVIPGKLKEIEINGKKLQKVSEIIGEFPVIAIAPNEIYSLLLTSEARRKIIDQLICQYDKGYLKNLQLYNSILIRRNSVLKQTERFNYIDPLLIQTFDEQLVKSGSEIYKTRTQFLEELTSIFESYYIKVCSNRESCTFDYKSDLKDIDFGLLLKEKLEKDFYLNRTSVGIHKDDIVFMINGHPMNAFGSQGQLKSFVIALKLSLFNMLKKHNRHTPILLLDDIFDKFDEFRTEALMEILFSSEIGQVFISDANMNRLPDLMKNVELPFNRFEIDNGEIK